MQNDPYYKKTVEFPESGKKLKFHIGETLFSSFQIDAGSELLLNTLRREYKVAPETVLDLGAGYGTLGITLASRYPKSQVRMIERDLLSVKYCEGNIKENHIENAEVMCGLGTEPVSDQRFDLIVSNIPAQIGDKAIEEEFILKPLELLNDSGQYWFVVVSALNRLIPKIGSKNGLNLKQIDKRSRYTIYCVS